MYSSSTSITVLLCSAVREGGFQGFRDSDAVSAKTERTKTVQNKRCRT